MPLLQGRLSGRALAGQISSRQRADVSARGAPWGRDVVQAPAVTPRVTTAWQPTDTGQVAFWVRGDFGVGPTWWNDASGKNLPAYQDFGAPYEPTLDDTTVNSKPGARFDGTAYYKLPTLPVGDTGGAGYEYTYVCVYQLDSTLGASTYSQLTFFLDDEGYSNALILCEAGTGYLPVSMKSRYAATDTAQGWGTSALYDNAAHACIATFDGVDSLDPASYGATDNGVTQTVTSTSVFANLAAGSIGGDVSATFNLTGAVAEVLIFQGALSAGDRAALDEYLARRYGTYVMTGTGGGALSPLDASGTGSHTTGGATGTGSADLSPLVAASSGSETFTGTGSGTLSSLVAASSGSETFTGTGSGTLQPLVADGSGVEVFTGTGDGALSPLVADGSGAESMTGTGTGTIQPLVAAASGGETLTGAGSGTISPLVASGSGAESFTATGSAALSSLVADGVAVETMSGSGGGVLASLVASGAGDESFTGTGAGVLSPLVAAASGLLTLTGTGAADLSPLVASGDGTVTSAGVTGTGSAELSPLVALADAIESFVATGSAAISSLVASGDGVESFVGTGSAALGPLVAEGAGALSISGSGAAALSPLSADGSATLTISGTGSASIASLVALGFWLPAHVGPRVTLTRSDARVDLAVSAAVTSLTRSDAGVDLAVDHAATTLATSTAKVTLR